MPRIKTYACIAAATSFMWLPILLIFLAPAYEPPKALRPVPPSPYGPPPTPNPSPTPPPSPDPSPNDVVQQLLDAHNKERAARGLKPLTLNPKLQEAAKAHSDYQAKVRRMGHYGIGDGSPWSRMQAAGYSYSNAGENVAWSQQNVAEVMKAWMGSPGHRANILGNYTECGLAVNDLYWTTDFGTPNAAGWWSSLPEFNTSQFSETPTGHASSTSTSTP